jgi:hypothetical protein
MKLFQAFPPTKYATKTMGNFEPFVREKPDVSPKTASHGRNGLDSEQAIALIAAYISAISLSGNGHKLFTILSLA